MSAALAKIKIAEARTALVAAASALAGAASLLETQDDCGLFAAVMRATADAVAQVAQCCELSARTL